MKKKGLLAVLVLIFLCACTFIGGNNHQETQLEEVQLLQDYDEIVKKAEDYSNESTNGTVESVFHHQSETLWKITFSNGIVVLYDETTGEMTHTED
ncbi:hypothetical protein [Bacillus sp. AK128]